MDELLIEQVKRHEVLYNHASPEYRDQQIRQESWEEIGRELEIKAEKAKELWDKLRRCFCNAINRRRDPTSGIAVKRKQPWKYEDQMSFILPFLERRRTRIKLNDSEPSEYIATDLIAKEENLGDDEEIEDADRYLVQEYVSVEDDGVDRLDLENFEQTVRNKNPTHQIVNIDATASRKRKCEDKIVPPPKRVPDVLEPPALDETDLFFLSLSKMTKQLPKVEQTIIKITLSNAVLTAELRCNRKQQDSSTPEQQHFENL